MVGRMERRVKCLFIGKLSHFAHIYSWSSSLGVPISRVPENDERDTMYLDSETKFPALCSSQ